MGRFSVKSAFLLAAGVLLLFGGIVLSVCNLFLLDFDVALCIPCFLALVGGAMLTVLGTAELPEVRR